VLGTIYEWPPRTSSALDTLLREIQNAREQHSRLDTLIRSYAAQDVKTGLNNRLFFDNQLATLLEDQEKVGMEERKIRREKKIQQLTVA
jgi:RNase E specificity factor CsrD